MRIAPVGLAAGLVFGTVAVLAAPANAALTSLTVSIVADDGNPNKAVTLQCEPAGGSHPDAKAACDDLIKAGGDFRKIPPQNAACPSFFDPVTATVQGTWRGLRIFTSARYGNAGCANVATGGHVLNF